jgi:hypothetical protein
MVGQIEARRAAGMEYSYSLISHNNYWFSLNVHQYGLSPIIKRYWKYNFMAGLHKKSFTNLKY